MRNCEVLSVECHRSLHVARTASSISSRTAEDGWIGSAEVSQSRMDPSGFSVMSFLRACVPAPSGPWDRPRCAAEIGCCLLGRFARFSYGVWRVTSTSTTDMVRPCASRPCEACVEVGEARRMRGSALRWLAFTYPDEQLHFAGKRTLGQRERGLIRTRVVSAVRP